MSCFTYSEAMGTVVAAVVLLGTIVIAAGPEARGVAFGRAPLSDVTAGETHVRHQIES